VPRDADEAAIRRAYRRAAKRAHPDGGGSPEAFERVSTAMRVLVDPRARQKYDTTGEAEPPGPDQTVSDALNAAGSALFTALQQVHSVETMDVLTQARQHLHQQIRGCKDAIVSIKQVIAKCEKVELRIKRKGRKRDNPLRDMIVGQISMFRRTIALNEQNIKTNEAALKILAEYEYQFAQPSQGFNFPPFLANSRDTRPW
jgi:curved DNA-binding protein CbpA